MTATADWAWWSYFRVGSDVISCGRIVDYDVGRRWLRYLPASGDDVLEAIYDELWVDPEQRVVLSIEDYDAVRRGVRPASFLALTGVDPRHYFADRDLDLDPWWHVVRPRLTTIATTELLTADDLERDLRACLAPHLAPDAAETRVALPPAFKRYLDTIGPVSWLGQHIDRDFILHPAQAVRQMTEQALDTFDEPGVAGDGVWIQFAGRGDRTSWFLCCDRSHPLYGQVGEGYDSHPWLNGTEWCWQRSSFPAWLHGVETSRARPRPPALLALTPDELAALRRALAEPRAAMIEVRELAGRLVPDAWAHTRHAISRAMLVVDAAPLDRGPIVHESDEAQAWLADPARVRALGERRPAVPAYGALAWDAARSELRPIEDAAGCVQDFYRRAATAGHAVLLLVESVSEAHGDD